VGPWPWAPHQKTITIISKKGYNTFTGLGGILHTAKRKHLNYLYLNSTALFVNKTNKIKSSINMHHEMFKQNNEHVQLENPHGEETPNGIYVCFALQYCTSFLHWDISSYNHALASIGFGALSTPSFSPSWLLALKFGSLTLIFNNGSKLQYALACGSCLHLLMIILIQLIY